MNIEWIEDLCGGTADRAAWVIKGAAGGVVVELRQGVHLNTSARRLENMRMEVLDGIRAGLGLPQDAIQEGDIAGSAAAVGALRRMLEASR